MYKIFPTKAERISSLTNDKGLFSIVAIDHRDVYRDIFQKNTGIIPTDEQILKSKYDIMKYLKDLCSSYLIDPLYCKCLQNDICAAPPENFMVGIEGNDYSGHTFNEDYLTKEITIGGIKQVGGSCVKMFMYYHPEASISEIQLKLIKKVACECSKYELPFLFEPIIPYKKDDDINSKLMLTKAMIEQLNDCGVDIFKLAFPGDVSILNDKENLEICKWVSAHLSVPWIILSSGVEMNVFYKQVELASAGGASGFAAGRTLWQNVIGTEGNLSSDKWKQMADVLTKLNCIINSRAKPWKQVNK